jgi:hypothetical protein
MIDFSNVQQSILYVDLNKPLLIAFLARKFVRRVALEPEGHSTDRCAATFFKMGKLW